MRHKMEGYRVGVDDQRVDKAFEYRDAQIGSYNITQHVHIMIT